MTLELSTQIPNFPITCFCKITIESDSPTAHFITPETVFYIELSEFPLDQNRLNKSIKQSTRTCSFCRNSAVFSVRSETSISNYNMVELGSLGGGYGSFSLSYLCYSCINTINSAVRRLLSENSEKILAEQI